MALCSCSERFAASGHLSANMGHSAPMISSNEGVAEALGKALGAAVLDTVEAHGEISFTVGRKKLPDVMEKLRSEHSVYLLNSGRINIGGARLETIPRLADCILAVL